MTDRLERALRDMRFETPDSLIARALASAEVADAGRLERPRAGAPERRSRSMTVATVIAVLLVAALLVALVYGAQAIRSRPVPVTPPVGSSDTSQPAAIAAPFAPDCSAIHNAYGCGMQEPFFANANVGWLTAGYEGDSGRTNLYRTTDGGRHWTVLISWDGPGAADIKTSSDGRLALIVTGWGPYGPAIISTSDGGQHWNNAGVPNVVFQCMSVAGNCEPALQSIFFLDTHEGWLFDQGPTMTSARLFHTVDAGLHWTLATTIDLTVQFPELNPVGLQGQFVFSSSTTGWFVPSDGQPARTPLTLYRTADGGATWHIQHIAAPSDSLSGPSRIEDLNAFDARDAAIELESGKGAYVTTTSDGGSTWTDPQLTPLGSCGFTPCTVDFIDAQTWVAYSRGYLLRTTNAGAFWETVSAAPDSCCVLQFTDIQHGWTLGGVTAPAGQATANALFRTTDGGLHWTQVSLPVEYTDLFPA